MLEVTEFPRPVREIENVFIPLADGRRLAARLWLPEDAESDPVPAVIEYMPYRKRDHFRPRDSRIHRYLAGSWLRLPAGGRAGLGGFRRTPARRMGGSGELDDGVEMIEWAARQPWSTGTVGMIGKSWSGFTCLTLAARAPAALGAIMPGLLRRRPLPPVAALDRGRLPAGAALVDGHDGALQLAPAGPGHRGGGLAPHVAGASGRQLALDRHLARPPASRRLLAARLDLRGLGGHPLSGLGRREAGPTTSRAPCRACSRTSTLPAGGSSGHGVITIRTKRCRGRRSASSRSACASTTDS